MEIMDYLQVILKRKLIIASSFIVVVGLAGAYLFLTDPIYESNCKILLIDDKNNGTVADFKIDDFMMQTIGKSDPILTQILLMSTWPVINEVINRCNIRDPETGQPAQVQNVLKNFKFEQVKATNIVKISCRDKDKQKATLYANTLSEVFAKQNQFLNQEEVRNVKKFLEEQLAIQKKNLEDAEQAVMEFKSSSKTVSIDKQTNSRIDALAELEAERIKLESELKGLKAQKEEIKKRLNVSGSQASPYYSNLSSSMEDVSISFTNITAKLKEINSQLELQYQDMKDLPPLEIRLSRLMREERIMNEIYTNMLSRYEEYKIREAARVASIKIIEPAVVPIKPVLPPKIKGGVLALFAGLFIGLGLAFFLEYIRDRPNNIDEIKKILNTSSLGCVPYFKKSSPLFVKADPYSPQSEAIRLLHTNLKFTDVVDKQHAMIMVTSTRPDEGKTTISSNLALVFAEMGKRTALIDLDLRRPAFYKIFGRRFDAGITDHFVKEVNVEQVGWIAEFNQNLTVFPSGQIPPNPSELMVSAKMARFIEQIKSSFDILLFDTAPITMISESLDIARKMDGIILVTDLLGTSRKGLHMMKELLQGKGLPVLGVVINKIGRGSGGVYGNYGAYYYNQKKRHIMHRGMSIE